MPNRFLPTQPPVSGWGVWRAINAGMVRESGGGYALIVDAKNPEARFFYERHGFRPFLDTPLSLYLPLGG
jgi:hypothetical protein